MKSPEGVSHIAYRRAAPTKPRTPARPATLIGKPSLAALDDEDELEPLVVVPLEAPVVVTVEDPEPVVVAPELPESVLPPALVAPAAALSEVALLTQLKKKGKCQTRS